MAGAVTPPGSQAANLAEMKRVALEAKLAKAIERVQNNYIRIDKVEQKLQSAGPAHLGKHIDVRV